MLFRTVHANGVFSIRGAQDAQCVQDAQAAHDARTRHTLRTRRRGRTLRNIRTTRQLRTHTRARVCTAQIAMPTNAVQFHATRNSHCVCLSGVDFDRRHRHRLERRGASVGRANPRRPASRRAPLGHATIQSMKFTTKLSQL